jgi:hypothetical protein
VTVATDRFAQWVALDTPDHEASDSWFHLPPGTERTVVLEPFVPFDPGSGPEGPQGPGPDVSPPRGRVRALNGLHPVPILPAE